MSTLDLSRPPTPLPSTYSAKKASHRRHHILHRINNTNRSQKVLLLRSGSRKSPVFKSGRNEKERSPSKREPWRKDAKQNTRRPSPPRDTHAVVSTYRSPSLMCVYGFNYLHLFVTVIMWSRAILQAQEGGIEGERNIAFPSLQQHATDPYLQPCRVACRASARKTHQSGQAYSSILTAKTNKHAGLRDATPLLHQSSILLGTMIHAQLSLSSKEGSHGRLVCCRAIFTGDRRQSIMHHATWRKRGNYTGCLVRTDMHLIYDAAETTATAARTKITPTKEQPRPWASLRRKFFFTLQTTANQPQTALPRISAFGFRRSACAYNEAITILN